MATNFSFKKSVTPTNIDQWDVNFICGKSELLYKLMEFGLIPQNVHCIRGHSTPMTLTKDGDNYKWRCYHYINSKKGKKVMRKRCNYGQTYNMHTFFHNTKLEKAKICKFVIYWIRNVQLSDIMSFTGIGSGKTCVDWASFCREVTYDDAISHMEKLGGPNVIVEIDESKFGKRKYNRGKHVEGQWVFGAYDRSTGRCLMVPVESRNSETLLPIIEQWILPGTTIISDCWKVYQCLGSRGYVHQMVNHSVTFKDPETGAHTNSIEGSWAHAKKSIPPSGRRKQFMAGYLSKFLFLKRCRVQNLDPFVEFCRIAGRLYDPRNWDPQTDLVDETADSCSDLSEESDLK